MARKVTIPLSDALEARVQAQANARGTSLDECILSILTEALSDIPKVPEDREQLAAELRKGLASPAKQLSDDDWANKEASLIARHTRSRAG